MFPYSSASLVGARFRDFCVPARRVGSRRESKRISGAGVVFAGKRVPQGRGSFGFGSRVRLPAVAGLPALVCLLDVVGLPAVAGPALPSSRRSERSEDRFLSERSLRGESLFLSLLDLGPASVGLPRPLRRPVVSSAP